MHSVEAAPGRRVVGRILKNLLDRAQGVRVADVRVGLGYSAVQLDDGNLGVAFTFTDQARGGCTVFHGMRPLASRPASDLLSLLASADPIEAGVGLACANALANRKGIGAVDGDVLDRVELGPQDDVAMVGHFGPLVGAIKKRAHSLVVLERVTTPTGELRPMQEFVDVLPKSQVVFITATSIINHTIDDLLTAAKGCREVVVLGPSTPLLPEAFAGESVTMLSGVLAKAPKDILRVVSEGAACGRSSPTCAR